MTFNMTNLSVTNSNSLDQPCLCAICRDTVSPALNKGWSFLAPRHIKKYGIKCRICDGCRAIHIKTDQNFDLSLPCIISTKPFFNDFHLFNDYVNKNSGV